MRNQSRRALALLIPGLMLITVIGILARQFNWPDSIRGLTTGVGIGLEILALISLRLRRVG